MKVLICLRPFLTTMSKTIRIRCSLVKETGLAQFPLFTCTHKGEMMGLGRKSIPPINKKFQVEFCTVGHWKNGQIDEENLFYDQAGMMRHLRLDAVAKRFDIISHKLTNNMIVNGF
jgi:hypothetical protein